MRNFSCDVTNNNEEIANYTCRAICKWKCNANSKGNCHSTTSAVRVPALEIVTHNFYVIVSCFTLSTDNIFNLIFYLSMQYEVCGANLVAELRPTHWCENASRVTNAVRPSALGELP